MARRCTICNHPNRTEIETALINQISYRNISAKFSVSEASAFRHSKTHLPETLGRIQEINRLQPVKEVRRVARVIEANEAKHQLNSAAVLAELGRCIERVRLLLEACDRYLRDPENSEQYTLEARAHEVSVVYSENGGKDGKPVTKKRRLSELLAEVEENSGVRFRAAHIKHSDIRELVLKTMSECRANLGFLVDLEIIEHNRLQTRFFAEKLCQFMEQLEPGLSRQFFERLDQERTIKGELSIPARRVREDESF